LSFLQSVNRRSLIILRSRLKEGGNVGIHDATNSTRARRQALINRVKKEPGLKLFFIESICTDPVVIAANIAVKVASGDPDYDGMEPEESERDFRARIALYEKSYEPLDDVKDVDVQYCKLVNVGTQVRRLVMREMLAGSDIQQLIQVTVNKIDGYLQSRIAFYLMNLHLTPRSIFFTRVRPTLYDL
jgi:6-phosphofructo-2-kinase/fructose-2,6-biphosphatase 2